MRFERRLYTVPLRLRSLFRRNRVEQELDDELQFHVERLTEEPVARGDSLATSGQKQAPTINYLQRNYV